MKKNKNIFKIFLASYLLVIISSILCFNVYASVIIKIIGVNPSKTQKQTIKIKAYLPEEIRTEDVLDKNDLDLIYDEQKNLYYVSGEYPASPGETIERQVELNDIWTVTTDNFTNIRKDVEIVFNSLADSEFASRAEFIRSSIEKKLVQIEESQKNPTTNPQRHISRYRDNKKILASIQDDLALARSLASQVKRIPTAKLWQVFVMVIGFLAILGVGLYIIWNRQSKYLEKTAQTQNLKPQDQDVSSPQIFRTKDKEESSKDIEDILGKSE